MPLTQGSKEVSYTAVTSNVAIAAASEATADVVATAPVIVADGFTSYDLEFQCGDVAAPANAALNVWLYLDGSSIGWMCQQYNGATGAGWGEPIRLSARVTPAAGSRTYSIRASQQFGGITLNAGYFGTGIFVPMFLRITRV